MMQPTNASISSLSPELLRLILENLCAHCCGYRECPRWAEPFEVRTSLQESSSALFNACLVSRGFRDTAQEIMHHQFYPNPSPAKFCRWERRLEPFLRTMASRPDLAASVRTVYIVHSVFLRLDFSHGREAFEQCAHALGTSASELWEQRKHDYPTVPTRRQQLERAFLVGGPTPGELEWDICIPVVGCELLTMLVALLPNLRHLNLEQDIEHNARWVDLCAATANSLGLKRLPIKTLGIEQPTRTLMGLVPDLDTLVLERSANVFWPQLPSVKTLCFTWAWESTVRLGLSICTDKLSAFYYIGSHCTEADIFKILDTQRLRAALECIHLDVRHQVYRGSPLSSDVMPSFRAFTKLETLFLTVHAIYDKSWPSLDPQSLVNILPPNITSLTLVDNDVPISPERLRQGLLGLATAKPTLFSRLKQIRCDSKEACDEHVRSAFEVIGVDFNYQEFARRDWSYTREPLPERPKTPDGMFRCGGQPLPDEFSDDDL